MSAYVVDKSHIDRMVSAALKAHPAGHPGTTRRLRWWRVDESGDYAGWRELNTNAEQMTEDDYMSYYTPSELGQMLLNENIASVSYRYSEPGRASYYGAETAASMDDLEDTDLPGPCDRYYLGPYIYEDPRVEMTPGQVFEHIDCLDYQSCEHPGWRSSEAFAFLTSLRDAYCRQVIAAEDAAVADS